MKNYRLGNSIFKSQLLMFKTLILIEILFRSSFKVNTKFFRDEFWTRLYWTKHKYSSFLRTSISRELHRLYLQNKYNEVIVFSNGIDTSKLTPKDLKVLSKSHLVLGHFNEHNRLNQQILEIRSNLTIPEIINQLSVSKSPNVEHKYSSQRYGGMGNLGIISHIIDGSPKYITKIKDMSNQKSDLHIEEFFYKQLLTTYPTLKEHTPTFLDYKEFNKGKISAITIQYIAGRHPMIEDLGLLFNLQKKILEINVSRLINAPVKEISIRDKLLYSTKTYWQFIVWKIEQQLTFSDVHSFATEISWIKKIIDSDDFRKYLSNNEMFALQHNDFGSGNIIISEEDNIAVAIDWGGISISIYGNDLIHFLVTQGSSLKEIDSKVIKPLCLTKPHLKYALSIALTLHTLYRKINFAKEAPDFVKDFNQAILNLKELEAEN